jgi:hypothetical protein
MVSWILPFHHKSFFAPKRKKKKRAKIVNVHLILGFRNDFKSNRKK